MSSIQILKQRLHGRYVQKPVLLNCLAEGAAHRRHRNQEKTEATEVCLEVSSANLTFGLVTEGVGQLAQTQPICAAPWRMAKSWCSSGEARSPDFSVKSDF